MTGNEAISVLLNAYRYEVEKGGRDCGKTAMKTALLMGANSISLIQKAMSDDEYWTAEKIEVLEGLLKEGVAAKEQYEELQEAFVDFVCSGTNNPAPYCKNRCNECTDSWGYCNGIKCYGFNPDVKM